jgi:hypothetical protein
LVKAVGGVLSETTLRELGLTPKALTVRKDDAMINSDVSFMVDTVGVCC